MKQKTLRILILACAILILPKADVTAQSNLKCPPTKSFFKSEKKKGFLSGIFKKKDNRPRAKVFYQPEEPVVEEEKVAKSTMYKQRGKQSRKNRRAAAKLQRSNGRQVATTKCPPGRK